MLNSPAFFIDTHSNVISRLAHRQQARPIRQQSLLLATLLAYLVAGAIVPRGHMAAPLASGTPFHLCPGDLRSALIIATLAEKAEHHHQHHHHEENNSGVDKTSADPGCTFAGFGAALVQEPGTANEQVTTGPLMAVRPLLAHHTAAWLRPPARSPPA